MRNDNLLLVIASDRVSTHNVTHISTIPQKGEVLTALTVFWIKQIDDLGIKTHLVASGEEVYKFLPEADYPKDFHHRALIVQKLTMIPIEFIFRTHMAGSLWKKYYSKGLPNPYGIDLPQGLELMSPFEEVIFTPTEKSETDDELESQDVIQTYNAAYEKAKLAYYHCRIFASTQGIAIIDTKLEVGIDVYGEICIADELFTPDSSRFVDVKGIKIGTEPEWYDKQILREEAERIWGDGPKVPLTFSDGICEKTRMQYQRIFEMITKH